MWMSSRRGNDDGVSGRTSGLPVPEPCYDFRWVEWHDDAQPGTRKAQHAHYSTLTILKEAAHGSLPTPKIAKNEWH
jgi:hypothetical protein